MSETVFSRPEVAEGAITIVGEKAVACQDLQFVSASHQVIQLTACFQYPRFYEAAYLYKTVVI